MLTEHPDPAKWHERLMKAQYMVTTNAQAVRAFRLDRGAESKKAGPPDYSKGEHRPQLEAHWDDLKITKADSPQVISTSKGKMPIR
jgi:hypothetical protein